MQAARWLQLSGWGALAGALIHVAAIAGGPEWFLYFRAPPQVVESARAGTWLAPVSALAIAGAMALCAAYAFSAAGRLPRLPLMRTALATIAAICLLRAVSTIPIYLYWPHLIDTFEVVAGIVWGVIGLGFAMGLRRDDGGGGRRQAQPMPPSAA